VISAIIEREPPRPPGVPDLIWEVLEKALAKDAAARFADATELGIALRRASGRTSTTDSGAQSLPSSARMRIVPPLGGDSHVTVPPAGTESEAPGASADAMPAGATSAAARRRWVRIALAVVGAAMALTVAALLRGPTRSDEEARRAAGRTPDAVVSAPVSAPVPTPVLLPSKEVVAAADAGRAAVAPGPAVPRSPPAQRPPSPLPPPKKEPSLVRDPGF
jgi:hypothetical protein